MSGTAQTAPITTPEILAGRRESTERIQGYDSIESSRGRNGAIVREIGRVAERDLEFALELTEDLETSLQINALAVIGKNAGEIEPLTRARDMIEYADGLDPEEKGNKLAKIANASLLIDTEFAVETAGAIPQPAKRTDSLLDLAETMNDRFLHPRQFLERNPNVAESVAQLKIPATFSFNLFREVLQEADRTLIHEDVSGDGYRDRRLADISGNFDLRTTYNAVRRSDPHRALGVVQQHVRKYIEHGRGSLFDLDNADPSGKLVLSALEARVPGKDEGKWPHLDPIVHGAALLRHYELYRREDYPKLLSIIIRAATNKLEGEEH